MMRIGSIIILVLFFSILCVQTSQAQQQVQQSDFNDFIDNTVKSIKDTGEQFVKSGQSTFTGTISAIQEMFKVFSGGDCEPGPVGDYYSITVLALITVSFVITIIYLVGQIMQRSDMIALAKNEYFQLGMTLIRLVLLAGAVLAGKMFIQIKVANVPPNDIVYYGRNDIIDAAMAISRFMTNEITKNYSALVLYNMILYTIQTATLNVGVNFRSMYNFNLGVALKPFIDIISMGMQALTLALGEWLTHIALLCFIKKWSWTILIPISIFVRSFPPTRQVGEALFALVIALMIFYPFMFIVTYETHKLLSPYLVDTLSEVQKMATKTGIFGVGAMVLAVAMLGGGAVVPIIGGIAVMGAYDLMKNVVYYVVIMSILMPFFTIFVTLTAAREIAKAGGVDVNYMSFLKII